MSKGDPFNLLKNHPVDGIPVAVTTGKMATWASERGRRHPGLDGLGELCYGGKELIGPNEFWGSGRDPRNGFPKYFDYYHTQFDPEEVDEWCRYKTLKHRDCDRLLVAQNCHADSEGRITIPQNYQWHAPRTGRYKHDFTSPSSGYVRPWRGPAGDIERWTTEPYASFLPYTWKFSSFETDSQLRRHGNILNEAARQLFEDRIYPDSWNITDENGELAQPVYRVEYVNKINRFDGLPWTELRTIDDAIEYIMTGTTFELDGVEYDPPEMKIIWWMKIPEDGDLELCREGIEAGDITDQIGCPKDGTAFDLMVYTSHYSKRTYEWTHWEQGQYGPDPVFDGYTYELTSESSLDRWYRTAVRIVKPLPPRQEGGVQV